MLSHTSNTRVLTPPAPGCFHPFNPSHRGVTTPVFEAYLPRYLRLAKAGAPRRQPRQKKWRGRLCLPPPPGRRRGVCVCVTPSPNSFLVLPDREDRAVVVDVEAIAFLAHMTALQFVLGRQRRLTDLNIANIKAN